MFGAAWQVGLVAIVVTLIFSIINKKMTNQARMKEIKEKINDHQKRYIEAKKSGNAAEIAKLDAEQKEVMSLTKEMMLSSFKPSLVTFVPAMIVLTLMNSTYGNMGNIVKLPVVGWELTWFWLYLLVSLFVMLVVEITYKQMQKRKAQALGKVS